MQKIRKPAVAGLFYPSSEKDLNGEINFLLANYSLQNKIENISGIVAPHAGYKYSGSTAAYAYNLVKQKKYKNIFILSPSHREYFNGICIYEGNAYSTPFGIVEINQEISNQLIDEKGFFYRGIDGHTQEHAVEVHLPFLQTIFNDFKIIPIVMGEQNKFLIDLLAEKLSSVMDENSLIIASSDLSHYYPDNISNKLDSVVEKNINDFAYDNLAFNLEKRNCEACGGGLIVAMMKALKLYGKDKAKVLFRCNSGDVTGDYNEVVGYLSAAIYN